MEMIGNDCWDIINDYKNELENIENHKESFKNTLKELNEYFENDELFEIADDEYVYQSCDCCNDLIINVCEKGSFCIKTDYNMENKRYFGIRIWKNELCFKCLIHFHKIDDIKEKSLKIIRKT